MKIGKVPFKKVGKFSLTCWFEDGTQYRIRKCIGSRGDPRVGFAAAFENGYRLEAIRNLGYFDNPEEAYKACLLDYEAHFPGK